MTVCGFSSNATRSIAAATKSLLSDRFVFPEAINIYESNPITIPVCWTFANIDLAGLVNNNVTKIRNLTPHDFFGVSEVSGTNRPSKFRRFHRLGPNTDPNIFE